MARGSTANEHLCAGRSTRAPLASLRVIVLVPAVVLKLCLSCLLVIASVARAAEPSANPIPVHDPVIIREDGKYYIFATGRGIAVWSSPDLQQWTREEPVFAEPPPWAVEAVATFKGHIWAPDISAHEGTFYLYYSISAFGKNTSCIGVATNQTLNPADPRFRWHDHGKVIQSIPGYTNWNAIDPNLIVDEAGTPFLSFGSFWSGLKLVKLAPDRLRVADGEDLENLPTIASRMTDPGAANPPAVGANPADAGGNAIEAPFIFRHGEWYYLFASIDYCCKGAASDYKMIVGRSRTVAGPYLDRAGVSLARGGGTILLTGNERWHGVGHNAVASFDGVDYLVFHGYDATDDRGRAKLRIEKLTWDSEGWPVPASADLPKSSEG